LSVLYSCYDLFQRFRDKILYIHHGVLFVRFVGNMPQSGACVTNTATLSK
jgi:hypothetical protein